MSKKIPIGISNFKVLRENGYYYFDKTKFIESVIEQFGKSLLFTRPRRFGKTLNMSMLGYFFDIVNAEENRNLFKDLYIEKTDSFRCQGQYPVIYISLKDLKLDSFEETIEELKNLIAELYEEHLDILENLSSFNRDIFNHILTRNTNMVELRTL
ncbi:Predicted AAA-ATPase [Fusobacterium necrophorum subsp. necrophorum]|nr:Predicted AAA-ATPase [Fusobacterium necrophorum subsp. necrophorum]